MTFPTENLPIVVKTLQGVYLEFRDAQRVRDESLGDDRPTDFPAFSLDSAASDDVSRLSDLASSLGMLIFASGGFDAIRQVTAALEDQADTPTAAWFIHQWQFLN